MEAYVSVKYILKTYGCAIQKMKTLVLTLLTRGPKQNLHNNFHNICYKIKINSRNYDTNKKHLTINSNDSNHYRE